ncbi:MAG TPA: YihY family inner membrane protein [Chromatiales bacterium]|nr:YihY family inner membrane protein [Chromatiales bacterium]
MHFLPRPWQQRIESLWRADLSGLPRWQAALLWAARMLAALLRDLSDGQLTLRAMSLVYTTLLSLVPLLAVSFSVLKAFGVHNQIEPLLLRLMAPLGAQGVEFTRQIIGFVDNIKVGVLGSVGLVVLLYTVVTMIQKTEEAFNYTWRVTRPRAFTTRLSNYLTVILLGPVLMFAAVGVAASLARSPWVQTVAAMEPLGSLLHAVGALIPYLLIGAAFALTYLLIPNTHVRTGAAVTGGVVAGVLWVATGKLFTLFVVESAKYTAIYSGFAIVLLFMIWVYLSWLIVLVGASVAFYQQHPEYLSAPSHESALSLRMQERFALGLMVHVAARFERGEPAPTLRGLSETLGLPGPAVDHLLELLREAGLILQTGEDPPGYVPARPPERVEVAQVMEAVRSAGERVLLPGGARRATGPVDEVMEAWCNGAHRAVAGITLKALAERLQGAPVVARIGSDAEGEREASGE